MKLSTRHFREHNLRLSGITHVQPHEKTYWLVGMCPNLQILYISPRNYPVERGPFWSFEGTRENVDVYIDATTQKTKLVCFHLGGASTVEYFQSKFYILLARSVGREQCEGSTVPSELLRTNLNLTTITTVGWPEVGRVYGWPFQIADSSEFAR
jgi:hypothetical protein